MQVQRLTCNSGVKGTISLAFRTRGRVSNDIGYTRLVQFTTRYHLDAF